MGCSSIDCILREFTQRLIACKRDSPRLSAEILLAFSMGIPREDLLKLHILSPGTIVDSQTLERAVAFLHRRELGEPVAYIVGHKEFYGRDFFVNSSTLVPRPDTEVLIEACVSHANFPLGEGRLADLGAGSGCIAITLAIELKARLAFAVDISHEALRVVRENALALSASQIVCLQADFTQPIFQDSSLNLIVSNPPYVSAGEYVSLDREVKSFEPSTALVPSRIVNSAYSTGLECYPALLSRAESALVSGGSLFLEVGSTQAVSVARMFTPQIWCDVALHHDLAGHARVVSGVRC